MNRLKLGKRNYKSSKYWLSRTLAKFLIDMVAKMKHYSRSYMITMTIPRNLNMKLVRPILKVYVIWKCQFIARNIRRSNESLKRSTQRTRKIISNNSLRPIRTKLRVYNTILKHIKVFIMNKQLKSSKRINGW